MVAFAALSWHRRWISDDGLIYVRVVRQILAGNGPVFNLGERSEATTSALWTWLLAGASGATRIAPATLAIMLSGALSLGAVALAMDATRRLRRRRGASEVIVPCGALVVIGASPFWDFATSGLETGLVLAWLAVCWWLLVTASRALPVRRQFATAIAIGLGPLVRPELALASAVFAAAAWWLVRPRRPLVLVAAALALPIIYELFRAGYYAALVPLPALAKSAAEAEWGRGAAYAWHFVGTYFVWIPLAVAGAIGGSAWRRAAVAATPDEVGDRVRVIAPIAAGCALALYVLRVGGDFMHGRMMLAPVFAMLLPAMVVPVRRAIVPAIAIVGIWAVVTAIAVHRYHGTNWYADWDERRSYVHLTDDDHPTDPDEFARAIPVTAVYERARRDGWSNRVFSDVDGASTPLDPALDVPVVIVAGMLGAGGVITPLDGVAADRLGLANPIGARIAPTHPGRVGHEKQLPWAWVLADYGDPAHDDDHFDRATSGAAIRAARHAMRCGALAELLEATRSPLSGARFLDNVTGAFARTRLAIPTNPFDAERAFCGDRAAASGPAHAR